MAGKTLCLYCMDINVHLTYRLSGSDEPKTVLFAFMGDGAIKKPAFFKNVK